MANGWQAKWIWAEGLLAHNNTYVEARNTFELRESFVARAELSITANQFYKLYINGSEVGRGPSPSDNQWKYYDRYEVARFLESGTNTVAILAYNFGNEPIVTGQMQGPGGLLCQMTIGEAADAQVVLATDAGWKCRRSTRWLPKVSRQHEWGGFREIYLAEQEDGWEQQGYCDSEWPSAVEVAVAEALDSPWPRLMERDIPHLSRREISPVALSGELTYGGSISGAEALLDDGEGRGLQVDASTPGSYPQITYDFGREVVGYPKLVVESPQGGVLQLHYGESLELELTDTFMLKAGRNVLEPFGRRAFRYMKLAVQATPQAITVQSLKLAFVHYPFPQQGSFRCSDELLGRIWETGKYTTIVNTQDHFEDCPHRERALWVADAVVMAKVVYHVFGDAAIVRKSLLQSARIQKEDGSLPGTGPERNLFTLPDFCAHWLFGVYEYVGYSGDTGFLAEIWPIIVKLADWFAAQEDDVGLFSRADREGWWCFIDWSDDIERKDRVSAISCFYYKFLQRASRLAQLLGEEGYGKRWAERATLLRNTIRTRLRAPGERLFADCLTDSGLSASVTAQTNFAAAWSGVMDRDEVIYFIKEVYLQGKLPRICGAFFYHVVLETLFSYGFAEAAIKQIREYWGDMLARGAQTWWETFDVALPFCTIPGPYQGHTPTYLRDAIPVSHSHGWGASPTNLLVSEVLGVDVSEMGEGVLILRPAPAGGLQWAEGVVPTCRGDIRVSWHVAAEEGKPQYEAWVPEGLAWRTVGLDGVQSATLNGYIRIIGSLRQALISLSEL